MADRTADFLCRTNIIDPTTQKAFLKGINGCMEHTQIMHELLANARNKHKTIHITYFDLADAFGSVEHSLIYHTLEKYHISNIVVSYIKNLYSHLEGKVTGPSWNSDSFSFKRGVFQGDPWSPIIFLAVFNPIVQYLKTQEETFGYKLEGKAIITLPFADDFCLITSNKRTHQKLINNIHIKTESMNLSLKPSKCRSISVCQGKSKEIPFKIGETPLLSVKDEPEKFLGMYITYHGKTSEIYQIMHDKLKTALENIENSEKRI